MKLLTLIKEDKVFSAFYISGTAIAIASALVAAFVFHILIADIDAESNRSRMVYVDNCRFESDELIDHIYYKSPEYIVRGCSKKFLELCKANITGIETALLYDKYNTVNVTVNRDESLIDTYEKKEQYSLIIANSAFFDTYDLEFICGRAFADTATFRQYSEYLGCNMTDGEAVINETLATRLFGSVEEAIGKRLYSDYTSGNMTVVGVVKNVSSLLPNASADVYANLECLFEGYNGGDSFDLVGRCNAMQFLMKDGVDIDRFRSEFNTMISKYERQLSEQMHLTITFGGMIRTHFSHALNVNPDVKDDNSVTQFAAVIGVVMFLLLLLPAVNLTGFVSNRMKEQQPELGIRKTYGASKFSLLWYVFQQNMVMTVCGGIVGYPIAIAFVSAMAKGEIGQMVVMHMSEGRYDGTVDMSMFFSPWLFIIAFFCCFVLTTLAALIPAIKALKKPIVEALNLGI